MDISRVADSRWKKIENWENISRLNHTLRFIPEEFKSKKLKVLDVGCGVGALTRRLKENTNWDITCLDASNYALDKMKEIGFKTIKLDLNKDADMLEGKYDLCLMTEVIEHVLFPQVVVDKLHGMCDYLLLTTPNFSNWRFRQTVLRGKCIQPFYEDHIRFFNVYEIKNLLEGWNIVKESYLMDKGNYNYIEITLLKNLLADLMFILAKSKKQE